MRTIDVKSYLAVVVLLSGIFAISISGQETKVASTEFPTVNCLSLLTQKESVIKEKSELMDLMRQDANRGLCVAKFSDFDFTQQSLIGLRLNTGYCRRPVSLESAVTSDSPNKLYLVTVTYAEPIGVCRALSRYDLWLAVPRIPDGFRVRFDIKPIPREKR